MDKPAQPQAVEKDCTGSLAYSADPATNQAREEDQWPVLQGLQRESLLEWSPFNGLTSFKMISKQ